MIEERNARIDSTQLGFWDDCPNGILLTSWINLKWDGGGQGFGGYGLGSRYASFWIEKVLNTLEVSRWEKLTGVFVRIRNEHVKVHAIGHILKDQWFYPDTMQAELEKAFPQTAGKEAA